MSLPYSPSRAIFDGNGVATRFPFTFRVWRPSEVAVSVTDPEGITTRATGYGVELAHTAGGTVTYVRNGAPLPAGWKLTILRDMPFAQGVDLLSGTRFDAQVIEDQLDQATAERQQLKEAVDRAVKLPASSDLTPEEYGRELLDAKDDAQQAAREAAESARKAEHALAETIETKTTAIREIREETKVQKDRLQAVADTTIITMNREADRAHDEADRAEREADRAARTATLGVGAHNLEATWTLDRDIPAGGLLTLPDALVYFPGRNMLRLSFEGIACYPGLHYEEVLVTRATPPCGKIEAFPDLPSGQIKLLFAAARGTVFNVWIVASNVAKFVEDAKEDIHDALDQATDQAEKSCACADESCACADEAEKARDTAVNAAQDAMDAAEQAAESAHKAVVGCCKMGIAALLEAASLASVPNGFYTLNPRMVVPATCSLPLYPVKDLSAVPDALDGFYLFAPYDKDCRPDGGSGGGTPPTPPPTPGGDTDCPDW